MRLDSNTSSRTVSLSFHGDMAVSECGYSVFGTRSVRATAALSRRRATLGRGIDMRADRVRTRA